MPEASLFTTRHYLSYIALLLLFGAGIWFILAAGSRLNSNRTIPLLPGESSSLNPSSNQQDKSESPRTYIGKVFQENLRSPLSTLLLQLIVIIVAARLFGKLFLKIGQPSVMGEMVAGIETG